MRYGENEAVRGIDFEVSRGEVFGFLGPNGAGKTTTIEILEGYRTRTRRRGQGARRGPGAADPGVAQPGGHGPAGVASSIPPLTVRETLSLFAAFYESPRGVDATIELVGLGDKRDARVGTLSGGQRRRVDVAVAIDRRPGPDLPGRADHRLRPLRPARVVEHDRGAQGAREDGLPDHPLHGRGPAPGGPGGDPARRGDRGPRAHRRAGRRRRGRHDDHPRSRLPEGVGTDRVAAEVGRPVEARGERGVAAAPRRPSGISTGCWRGPTATASPSRSSTCAGRASRTSSSSSPAIRRDGGG